MKITVIGSGNMGGALIKGWCKAGLAKDITITAHTQKTLDTFSALYPELTTSLDNVKAIKDADIIILAVKPWLIDQVLTDITPVIEGKVVVSVAAGVRNDRIDFYAMPNIAAEFGESMTFIETPSNSQLNAENVSNLFSHVGHVKNVTEKQMTSGMLLSGCGIAFVMRYIRALMESGVEMGFYPKDAQQIVEQTMLGAVKVLQYTELHPEAAIDKVTTPGGFTIKGLNKMEADGFTKAAQAPFK